MIGKLTGVVDAIGEDEAILDVGGVGYLVQCGSRTLSAMTVGEKSTVHIETYVREDQFKLFGFPSEDERAWFVRLQVIQGVGAKVALALLDVLTPGELMTAAAHEDSAAVSRAHGVGKRLAQRIVSELEGKPPPITRMGAPAMTQGAVVSAFPKKGAGAGGAASDTGAGEAGVLRDAASALANLGVGDADARVAVSRASAELGEGATLDALIKTALKEIGR